MQQVASREGLQLPSILSFAIPCLKVVRKTLLVLFRVFQLPFFFVAIGKWTDDVETLQTPLAIMGCTIRLSLPSTKYFTRRGIPWPCEAAFISWTPATGKNLKDIPDSHNRA